MTELRVLSSMGDTKVIFDPDNDDEVAAAKVQYKTLIDKGFKAFKVKKSGEPGKKMKRFDKDAGKIIMVPPIIGG
jgi:L-alanine-DL-glutamate epimerase-like enolase superfamily enzyme